MRGSRWLSRTRCGSRTSSTAAWLDGTDVEVLNWLDDHSRYLLSCTAHRPVTGDDVVSDIARPDRGIRAASLDADRQRERLHQPVHRRAQRVRIRPAATRHPPEERVPRTSPDPRQDRTFPPNAATLARGQANGTNDRRARTAARSVPRALQRTPPTPRPPTKNAGAGIPRHPQGHPRHQRARPRPLPPPLRPRSTPKAR